MRKAISILILLILLFFAFQWGMNYFKNGHEITYQVFLEDQVFEVDEKYQKDYYDIVIREGENAFHFTFDNHFNKQKKIVEKVEYFSEDGKSCIYPVLENGQSSYLECSSNHQLYTRFSFPDSNFVSQFVSSLEEKKYPVSHAFENLDTSTLGNSTIYQQALLENDVITFWNYKGIDLITKEDAVVRNVLNFDLYENKLGLLVGKYYVIPEYSNSKLLEFTEVNVIDLEKKEVEKVSLGFTLSSDAYTNGVIDGKIYYMDPSNLQQLEFNPSNQNTRLIGSVGIGGQVYHGSWENANIYDLANQQILFEEPIAEKVSQQFPNTHVLEGKKNYYFYNDNGEVYQVSKDNLEMPILLFQNSSFLDFIVVEDTIYYIDNDTLYYFEPGIGKVAVFKNNELRYNSLNRIDIYRKS